MTMTQTAVRRHLQAHEVVMMLLNGQREVRLRLNDERSAIGLYHQVQNVVKTLGLERKLPDLTVRLAPETATISFCPVPGCEDANLDFWTCEAGRQAGEYEPLGYFNCAGEWRDNPKRTRGDG